jgi:hypothetical protein
VAVPVGVRVIVAVGAERSREMSSTMAVVAMEVSSTDVSDGEVEGGDGEGVSTMRTTSFDSPLQALTPFWFSKLSIYMKFDEV